MPNYTGHLLHRAFWQDYFCVVGRLHKVLSANVPITHINCLGINFQLHTHICYTKELFPIYSCNHFGPQSNWVSEKLGAQFGYTVRTQEFFSPFCSGVPFTGFSLSGPLNHG